MSDHARDLDAEIAAAELRVIERDTRVLRHGQQLGERLSSRSTQARLALAGVAGVAAVVALVRLTRLTRRPSGASGGQAHGRHTGGAAVPQPASPSVWMQWLPVALQMVTAATRPAAAPPPAGLMGWVGPLLAAGRGFAGMRRGTPAQSAAGPATTPKSRPPAAPRSPR